jgi:glycosyltransferase involved in cell wall biosynthesis
MKESVSSASLIVVTLDMPECVRRCLERLLAQVPSPVQVIVTDASSTDETEALARKLSEVDYLRTDVGYHITRLRR